YWSMSPCTKRLQRSTRNFAPFSGALFHCACASLIQSIGATTVLAASVEPVLMNLRRVTFAICVSLVVVYFMLCSGRVRPLLRQRRARLGIEQMSPDRRKRDRFADPKAVALAEHRGDVGRSKLCKHLCVRASRLDHHHRSGQSIAIGGQLQILGTHAVDDLAS